MFQKSISNKLQDDIFGRLFNLNLLKFATKKLQDVFKIASVYLSLPLQLLTTISCNRDIKVYK